MSSMYRLTSWTEKKWRGTSSIAPRYANRGESAISTAGTVQGAEVETSCRSVCAAQNAPAGEPAVIRMPRSVDLRVYASAASDGSSSSDTAALSSLETASAEPSV